MQLTIPLGGAWSTELAAGRSGPDPLLNSPAGVDASLTLTWNALTVSTSAPPLYTLSEAPAGDPTALKGEPREVLFRLQHPGAESVSVIGDFSDWRPLPMRREGAAWIVQARVTPGVYHFGFLVDGEWYVPEEATGLVTDEFGRANATLVVPRR